MIFLLPILVVGTESANFAKVEASPSMHYRFIARQGLVNARICRLHDCAAAQSAGGSHGEIELGRQALAALERVGIADNSNEIAGQLAYGHQRLLEVAMGLA